MNIIKTIKRIRILIVIVVIGIIAFVVMNQSTINTQKTTAVVKEIRALNRWETASFTIEKIIDSGTNGNVFQQFLFGNRILLIAHGEVIGGFDLSQFSEKNMSVRGTNIEIRLPAPQILGAQIDNSKTRVYDRQQGLLVPSNNNLESEALTAAQTSIADAACSENILTTASTNAKSQLTSILSLFGFKNITIIIPPGHC
jgi:hypothetical protein